MHKLVFKGKDNKNSKQLVFFSVHHLNPDTLFLRNKEQCLDYSPSKIDPTTDTMFGVIQLFNRDTDRHKNYDCLFHHQSSKFKVQTHNLIISTS
jgi:hypothetical protein